MVVVIVVKYTCQNKICFFGGLKQGYSLSLIGTITVIIILSYLGISVELKW